MLQNCLCYICFTYDVVERQKFKVIVFVCIRFEKNQNTTKPMCGSNLISQHNVQIFFDRNIYYGGCDLIYM